jgi:hypothetical protein
MYEYTISSTTHGAVLVLAQSLMKAIHKVYADHNIVQDNIYAIVRGRKQEEDGTIISSVK